MKAILLVRFATVRDEGDQGSAKIEVDLPFTPNLDMYFSNTVVWYEPKQPDRITFDLEEGVLVISFEDRIPSKEDREAYAETYRENGWTLSGMMTERVAIAPR
jgi:hypothetical protein